MPAPAKGHRAARTCADCQRWQLVFRRNCVDFVAAVKVMFFSSPRFRAALFPNRLIACLATEGTLAKALPDRVVPSAKTSLA